MLYTFDQLTAFKSAIRQYRRVEKGIKIQCLVQVERLFQAKQAVALKGRQKRKKMNILDVKRATAIGVQARSLK